MIFQVKVAKSADDEEEVEVDEDSEVEEATFAALFLEQFATPEEISAMAESYDEMGAMSETMGGSYGKSYRSFGQKIPFGTLATSCCVQIS